MLYIINTPLYMEVWHWCAPTIPGGSFWVPRTPPRPFFNHTGPNVVPASHWTQRAWGRLSWTPLALDIPQSHPQLPPFHTGTWSRGGQNTDSFQWPLHLPAHPASNLHFPLPSLPSHLPTILISPPSSSCLSPMNIPRTLVFVTQ